MAAPTGRQQICGITLFRYLLAYTADRNDILAVPYIMDGFLDVLAFPVAKPALLKKIALVSAFGAVTGVAVQNIPAAFPDQLSRLVIIRVAAMVDVIAAAYFTVIPLCRFLILAVRACKGLAVFVDFHGFINHPGLPPEPHRQPNAAYLAERGVLIGYFCVAVFAFHSIHTTYIGRNMQEFIAARL